MAPTPAGGEGETGAATPEPGRDRSGSPPSRRALAAGLRRLASGLQASPSVGSILPRGAHDRSLDRSTDRASASAAPSYNSVRGGLLGASPCQTPTGGGAGVSAAVAQLQGQRDADRRRLAQLERKVEARLEEGQARERWAETQGSLNGLMEDVQALRLRVENLDARLWARTGAGPGAAGGASGGASGSGGDVSAARARELEQQLQAFEHRAKLGSAALEEAQRRQVSKLRRVEQALEDSFRRLAVVEAQFGSSSGHGYPQCHDTTLSRADGRALEARLGSLEVQQERADAALRDLAGHIGLDAHARSGLEASAAEDAVEAAERAAEQVASLEQRAGAQFQELSSAVASLRVKVDGQLQRLSHVADRLETAHEPAVDGVRHEFAQLRAQDHQRVEEAIASIRGQLQESSEASDEAVAQLTEDLRQVAHMVMTTAQFVQEEGRTRCDGGGSDEEGALQRTLLPGAAVFVAPPFAAGDASAPGGGGSSSSGWSGGGGSGSGRGRVRHPAPSEPLAQLQPPLPPGGAPSPLFAAGPELEVVAERLRAADALAARVAEVEQRASPSAHAAAAAAPSPPRGGSRAGCPASERGEAAAAVASLAHEVSELQARLLASQLQLQMEPSASSAFDGPVAAELHAAQSSEQPAPGAAEAAVWAEDEEGALLADLAARVCAAEVRWAAPVPGPPGSSGSGPAPRGAAEEDEAIEAEAEAEARAWAAAAAAEEHEERLSELAAQLGPLEDVFRGLAEQLTALGSSCCSEDLQGDCVLKEGNGMEDVCIDKAVASKPWSCHPQLQGALTAVRGEVRVLQEELEGLAAQVFEGAKTAAADGELRAELDRLWREALGHQSSAFKAAATTPPPKQATPSSCGTATDGSAGGGCASAAGGGAGTGVSPLAPVRGKLDTLCEQVAELHARTAPSASC